MKVQKLALALAIGVGGGLWASLPSTVLAAGNVDTTSGETSIASAGGQPRALSKGDRVQEGDTIVTGANGTVLITTDDSGVLAVRPRSRLTIDAYKVNGNAQDSVVLSLLRGSLRSITGWISKTAPKNYKITTATATVGIRGTDHEVTVGEASDAKDGNTPEDDAGTWNQVTEGATTLATPAGELEQQAGTPSAVGRVKAAGLAPLQALAPASLFKPQPTDSRTSELKKDAQTNQQQRLDTRQQQVSAAGGTTAQGNPKVSTQCAVNAPAQKIFDDLIRAYEQGDIAFLQQRLSPSMVGYSALINDVQTSTNAQRQTRIQIKDRQMQCGPDVASITFSWEKTFLDAISFQPGIVRGQSAMLIAGIASPQWTVSGITGDTPFKPPSKAGANGNVTVLQPTDTYGGTPTGCALTNPTITATLGVSVVPPTGAPSFALNAGITGTIPGNGICVIPSNLPFVCTLVLSSPTLNSVGTVGTAAVPAGPTPCKVLTPSSTGTGNVTSVPLTFTPSYGATPVITAPAGTQVNIPPIGLNFSAATSSPGASGTYFISAVTTGTCSGNALMPSAPAATVCTSTNSAINAVVEVNDPDLTSTSITVQAVSSTGDSEMLVFPRISAGIYRINTLQLTRGGNAPVPGNNRLDFGQTTGTVSVTFKYTDTNNTSGTSQLRQSTLTLTP